MRLPIIIVGTMIIGPISSTIKVSFQLIKNIIIKEPMLVAIERMAKETDEPMTDSIKVVSVVRRERTSPVWTRSKNSGERRVSLS